MQLVTKPKRTFKEYFFPYYTCNYKSNQSKEEILSKIASVTEPERFFRLGGFFRSKNTKDFEGEVRDSDFKISKITYRKNFLTPVVIGTLDNSSAITSIAVKFRLNLFVFVGVPIWLFFIFSSILTYSFSLEYDNGFDFANLFPLLLVLGVYVGITLYFHIQVTQHLKFLEKVILPIEDTSSKSDWIIRN